MKKTTKLGLAGIILSMALAGCATIRPKGHIDLSYLPQHLEHGKYTEQVFKTELEAGFETDIFNTDLDLNLGGTSTTYMVKDSDTVWFDPFLQKYGLFARVYNDFFELYAEHRCDHPVRNRQEVLLRDPNTNELYYINWGVYTEFGIKMKW